MRMRVSRVARGGRWLILAAALACVSCSGGGATLYPVKGKVLYKNQPLAGAQVTFHPKGADLKTVNPTGLTKEDGTFTVMTGPSEGAPAGEYTVTLICSEQVAPQGNKKVISTEMPETKDRLGGAYANRNTSTIKVEIKPGPNELQPFDLK
jgi:hypothetical protein